jgi:hypothetical protein
MYDDGMRLVHLSALIVFAASGCGIEKTSCNPDVYPDDCPVSEGCDPTTKKCELAATCKSDADCAGFLCTISGVCRRNCRGQTGPDDTQCATGNLCDPTKLTCAAATTCDPNQGDSGCNGLNCDAATSMCVTGADCVVDDDCGNYHCGSAGCYTSCTDFTQCGPTYTCDSFSNTCG